MRKYNKLIALGLILIANLQGPMAVAADISTASLLLSGNVPAVFSVTVRGYPGEFDLGPNTTVVDRVVGILHFKYNMPIASISFASSTASGRLENAAAQNITFATGGDYLKSTAGCTILDQVAGKLDGATDLAPALSVLAGAAPTTADMDCPLMMSWTTGASMQRAGVYSMTVTVTMTST
ncbi:MAG: hypothetical protein NDJ89_01425 [Oligoflexia bacterium]|nr:hypothetical protein [Oligoflexia bacterium]